MAYFASVLPSKRLKQPRVFKIIEVLIIQSKFGIKDAMVMGIYRSPKVTGKNYYVTLEKDLHDLDVPSQRQFIIIMGDLISTSSYRETRRERFYVILRKCMV